jgi:hypothetical protein
MLDDILNVIQIGIEKAYKKGQEFYHKGKTAEARNKFLFGTPPGMT